MDALKIMNVVFGVMYATMLLIPGWLEYDNYYCGPLICYDHVKQDTVIGFPLVIFSMLITILVILQAHPHKSIEGAIAFGNATVILLFCHLRTFILHSELGPFFMFSCWLMSVHALILYVIYRPKNEERHDVNELWTSREDDNEKEKGLFRDIKHTDESRNRPFGNTYSEPKTSWQNLQTVRPTKDAKRQDDKQNSEFESEFQSSLFDVADEEDDIMKGAQFTDYIKTTIGDDVGRRYPSNKPSPPMSVRQVPQPLMMNSTMSPTMHF